MQDYLKEEYKCVNGACVNYEGYLFLEGKFEECLRGKVKEKFKDSEWTEMLTEQAIESTGFTKENFEEIFVNREEESCWRIGEVIAEMVLEDKYNIRFYYNSSRDAKNLRSNMTGADLIGFCTLDGEVCFLFGEVKTSNDLSTPPNVLYGKTGMIHQLESLIKDKNKRHDLVKWVWGKAILIKGKFKEECAQALASYVKSNHCKLQLVGVLVRDTQPTERDLKARAGALNKDIPANMRVSLISLYSGFKMENKNWENAMNRGA